MVYMSGGSTIILVYLLVANKKRGQHDAMTLDVDGTRHAYPNPAITIEDDNDIEKNNNNNNEPRSDDTSLRHLSPSALSVKQFSHLNGDSLQSQKTPAQYSQASVMNRRVYLPGQDNNTQQTPTIRKRRRAESDADVLETSASDDVETELAHYITLNTQTASLSHEGTSFYLRFGCLRKSSFYLRYDWLCKSSAFKHNIDLI